MMRRGKKLMVHAKKNQITSGRNQNNRKNKKIWISLHDLFPPSILIDKIESNCNQTAKDGGNKISIENIRFIHVYPSFAKNKESRKNVTDKIIDIAELIMERKIFCGCMNRGEINPAENQATQMFPDISETLFIWPLENSTIGLILTKGNNYVN